MPGKNLLLLFLAVQTFTLNGQIAAGITDNLILGQDFFNLNVFAFNNNEYKEQIDSLDLNSDGKFDAIFYATAGKVPDFVGGITLLEAKDSRFEMIVDSIEGIQSFQIGDSITAQKNWGTSSNGAPFTGVFLAKFWGMSGTLEQYGNWIAPSDAYAGFRIINAQNDTLYGWMRVVSTVVPNGASASLKINSWAIQKPMLSSISTEATPDFIRILPNPVGNEVMILIEGDADAPKQFKLFDLQGNLLRQTFFSGKRLTADLSSMPGGMYIWEIVAERWKQHGKLLKQ